MIAKDLVPTSGINSFMIMKMSPGYVAVVATGPDELSTSTDRLRAPAAESSRRGG